MEIIREVRPGQIYRHFKNKMYQVVCVATHSETGEQLVVYQKLYDDYKVHARPYDMFISEVDHEKYPEVTQKYRFELVSPEHKLQVQIEKPVQAADSAAGDMTGEPTQQEDTEELEPSSQCSQDLLRFLEADTMEEKHNLLISMKPRLTDRLIDDLAASLDVIVEPGEIEKRYKSLLVCIDTKAKFECIR